MAISSHQYFQSFDDRVASSDRIFQLLGAATVLLTDLQDAESGQRGFLLTGKEAYLAPYRAVVGKIDRTFEAMVPMAGAIPNGPQRLDLLRTLTASKLAELKRSIDLYRSDGLTPALALVETDAGLHDMDQIRTELKGFLVDAYAARKARRDASVAATASTNLIVTFGGIALFLLLMFATFLIEQDQQKRRINALHIKELNRTLERKVRDRTQSLEEANRELEAFCYSVSHDLRAPLRSVDGFAKMLTRDYTGKSLDDRGNDLLRRMSASTVRMGQLIDDLLNLSRISRGQIDPAEVDLSALAAEVADALAAQNPGHSMEVSIEPGLLVDADARLLRVALENLFGNAWKFTRNQEQPTLKFGRSEEGFYVRDNGVGFDMAHSAQLFVPFQRLHSASEFEGTGIGLATVQRVIQTHGGKIWAESEPGSGAVFYFTIRSERRGALERDEADLDGGRQPGRRAAHA